MSLKLIHTVEILPENADYIALGHLHTGGEIFIVSFALSLALSYYIQHARKKSIQFFFIDEGFSSLDKDLLESVCNIFHELRSQDRLVGIISHISELKQIIPDNIYVYRDSTGASRIRQ